MGSSKHCEGGKDIQWMRELVFATAFANEAAAALNFALPGLYEAGASVTERPLAVASRMLIDLTALLSIAVIALLTYEDMNHDGTRTIVLTGVTLGFAFLLPNVTIRPFVEHACAKCSASVQVGASFGIIALLFLAESATRRFLIRVNNWPVGGDGE